MKKVFKLFCAVFLLSSVYSGQVLGQVSIDELNSMLTIDFNMFNGSGFTVDGSDGTLNSNSWKVTGMSDDVDTEFGGVDTTGDFARGSVTGGITTGGVYHFDANGVSVLGFQPGGSDFTPGTLVLRLQNNTGAVITELDISYNIYVYNDQGRSNFFNFSHSSDDIVYIDVSGLNYTTPEVGDDPVAWISVSKSTSLTGLNIGVNEFYYLRWNSDDVSGTGSRDEFGITNISVTAEGNEIAEPIVVATPSTLEGFSYNLGEGPSSEQILDITGLNLTNNITVTVSENFEISETSGELFSASNPITFEPSDGEVSKSIYVRLKSGLDVGEYNTNEKITISGLDFDNVIVNLSGIVLYNIVLNEFLADPPSGIDINGDGNASTTQDEFIEFVNTGSESVDISEWTLHEGAGQGHIFPNGTVLNPYQAIVIFSGGTEINGHFGDAITQISSSGFVLNNSGDDIILKDENDNVVVSYSYSTGASSDKSITRNPDLVGEFVQHDGIGFSPGTKVNGQPFEPKKIFITGTEGWRILSSPTSDNTYADLLGPLWTQGISTGADANSGDPNVMEFNGSSFQAIDNLNNAMPAGKGFITYVYDDHDYDGTPDGFPKTLSLSGTENAGTITPALNAGTEGWTLAGNPFSSAINWNEVTKTNLTGVVYVYDHTYGEVLEDSNDVLETGPVGGGYRTYNGSVGSLSDGIVAPFQGFWVQNSSSGVPELIIHETAKTTGGIFYKKGAEPISIKIRAEMDNMYSETFLSFTDHASAGKDDYDALKLSPLDFRNYLTLSAIADEQALDINNLPLDLEGEIEIPIQLNAYEANHGSGQWISKSGDVTFTWPEMKNIPEGWEISLKDYHNGNSFNLRETDSAEFTITTEGVAKEKQNASILIPQIPQPEVIRAKDSSNRFSLLIKKSKSVSNQTEKPVEFALEQNYPNPFNPVTTITYSIAESGMVSLEVYNVVGQKTAVLVDDVKAEGTYQLQWNAQDFASGIYYYRLKTNGRVMTRKMTLIK